MLFTRFLFTRLFEISYVDLRRAAVFFILVLYFAHFVVALGIAWRARCRAPAM